MWLKKEAITDTSWTYINQVLKISSGNLIFFYDCFVVCIISLPHHYWYLFEWVFTHTQKRESNKHFNLGLFNVSTLCFGFLETRVVFKIIAMCFKKWVNHEIFRRVFIFSSLNALVRLHILFQPNPNSNPGLLNYMSWYAWQKKNAPMIWAFPTKTQRKNTQCIFIEIKWHIMWNQWLRNWTHEFFGIS